MEAMATGGAPAVHTFVKSRCSCPCGVYVLFSFHTCFFRNTMMGTGYWGKIELRCELCEVCFGVLNNYNGKIIDCTHACGSRINECMTYVLYIRFLCRIVNHSAGLNWTGWIDKRWFKQAHVESTSPGHLNDSSEPRRQPTNKWNNVITDL